MTDTTSTSTSTTDASAADKAQQVAGTAADQGRHVGGVAADEARSVAGETKDHVKGLLDEARVQVDDQTRTQRDRLAQTLQSFGDDLHSMASNSDAGGLAADVARQAADRAQALGRHLDGREPSDLLDDVRRFARQRPGTFLLGALAAGVVAGRLARGAKEANSGSSESPTPYAAPVAAPPAPGTPSPVAAAPAPSTPSVPAVPPASSAPGGTFAPGGTSLS